MEFSATLPVKVFPAWWMVVCSGGFLLIFSHGKEAAFCLSIRLYFFLFFYGGGPIWFFVLVMLECIG